MEALFALIAQGTMPEVDVNAAASGGMDAFTQGAILLGAFFAGQVIVWALRRFLLPNLEGKTLAITATILVAVCAFLSHMVVLPQPWTLNNWMMAIGVAITEGLAAGKTWDLLPDKLTDKLEKGIKNHPKRAVSG